MKPTILATTIAALFAVTPAFAVTDTWDGGGGPNNNFFEGLNWLDNTAPLSDLANTDLIFAGTTSLFPNLNTLFSANSVTFNNTAGAFIIAGSTLTIGSGGIVNGDSQTQTFNTGIIVGTPATTFSAASGSLTFDSSVNIGANTLNVAAATGKFVSFNDFAGTGTVIKSGAGQMTVFDPLGGFSLFSVDLQVQAGEVSVGRAFFDTQGSLALEGGLFTVFSRMTVSSGQFTRSAAAGFGLLNNAIFTVQDGGSAAFTGDYALNSPATIRVTGSGSTLTSSGTLTFGGGSLVEITAGGSMSAAGFCDLNNTTVVVDGSGSSLSFGTGSCNWGTAGTHASLTVRNGASVSGPGFVLGQGAGGTGEVLIESGATMTINDFISVAANNDSATGTITVDGVGSTLTQAGPYSVFIGGATSSFGLLELKNGGTFNSGTASSTLNATGLVFMQNGGTYNANGNLMINGGVFLSTQNDAFNLAPGKVLTIQNGGGATIFNAAFAASNTVSITGANSSLGSDRVIIDGFSHLNITAGGDLFTEDLDVGRANFAGTVLVDGAGSTVSFTRFSTWGQNGNAAHVTLRNGASGTGGTVAMAAGVLPGLTSSTLRIESAASLTLTGDVRLAADGGFAGGSITITGSGSTLTLSNPTSALVVGTAQGGGPGAIVVDNGGIFNNSATTTIHRTGSVLLSNGGKWNAYGDVTLNGGNLVRDGGTFTLGSFRTLTIQNLGAATFVGDYVLNSAETINVVGAVSEMTTDPLSGVRIFNNGQIHITGGGLLETGFVNVAADGLSTGNLGTLTADGTGSSVIAPGDSSWGGLTGNAHVTFSHGAIGALGGLSVAATSYGAGSGRLNIESGAELTATSLNFGTAEEYSFAFMTITGTGSEMTVTDNGTVTIGSMGTNTATLSVLAGGAFASGTGAVTLNLTGHVIVDGGSVTLNGPLIQSGGSIEFIAGAFSFRSDFTVGAGGLFGSDLTLGSGRQISTTGTTTIAPAHTLTLDGGTLRTGGLVNGGTLDFRRGTLGITGGGGLTVGGGGALGSSVTLGTGANLDVTFKIIVNSGASLTVSGGSVTTGSLTNNGSTRLDAGAFTVLGGLSNEPGGQVFVSDILTIGGTLTNSAGGRITLRDGLGQLAGAGVLENMGLITGDGTIAKAVTNHPGGELRAENGKTLVLLGVNGVHGGKINLQGGTIEFNQELTNGPGGVIQGRGAAHFADGLVDQGVMNLSAGTTDIFGSVDLTGGISGTAKVIASGASTVTFYDDFRHNGAEVRASSGSRIVFFADVTGPGNFTGTGEVQMEGTYQPGASPAIITISPAFTFTSTATLVLEIGGTEPGPDHPGHLDGYDQIIFMSASTPQVTWDGTLRIDFINGFIPSVGDTFNLLNFDLNRDAGAFDHFVVTRDGVPDPGLMFDYGTFYETGTVTVAAVPEPATGVLLIFGTLLLRRQRR